MARYLYQRNGIWHFKKRLKGTKKMKRCSLHTRDLEVAIRKRDALLQKNSLLNEWDYGLYAEERSSTGMTKAEVHKHADRLFKCLETECLLACEEGLSMQNVLAVARGHLIHLEEVAAEIERKSNV